MRARKCDRCHKFYDGDIKNRLVYEKYTIGKLSTTSTRYKKLLDLCPDCCKELAEWFDNPPVKYEE